MPSGSSSLKAFELFVGCRGLPQTGSGSPNTFAVLYVQPEEVGRFNEISRTETICNSTAPQYCTSFELNLVENGIDEASVRIDVYERMTEESERLQDHKLLGNATIPINSIMMSEGRHLAAQIGHPSEQMEVGAVTLSVEDINLNNPEIATEIQLDVSAAVLRKKDWNKSTLGQRYEIHRAHQHDDSDGRTVWLPVWRSNRIAKQRDSRDVVEFSSVALGYRHACNGDDERRLRLTVYASSPISKKSSELITRFVDFTIRDLCELDPTEDVLPLEGCNAGVCELGHVAILRAEPTDFGSHFSLQVNHESNSKFTSALGHKLRPKKRKKEIAKRISMVMRDRSSTSNFEVDPTSPASTLFANSFEQ